METTPSLAKKNGKPPQDERGDDNPAIQWLKGFTKRRNIKSSLQYLDEKHITADLHTHLLGMGDHVFWIEEIMRNHLLFHVHNRPIASLEWYGPLACNIPPALKVVVSNCPDNETSVFKLSLLYGDKLVEEVQMNQCETNRTIVKKTIYPMEDNFTIVITNGAQTVTYEVRGFALSRKKQLDCNWQNNAETFNWDTGAKQAWESIGLPKESWKFWTMSNWHEMVPTSLTEDMIHNILKRHAFKEVLNLPLSVNLRDELARLDAGHLANWQEMFNFTTDIVFDVESFQESLNISAKLGLDNVRHELTVRLALNRNGYSSKKFLKKYMFFNAKTQQFDYQYGITNTDLCYLIDVDGSNLEAQVTLAQIRNCFTMLNVDGSSPSNADLTHRFQRHFTPEFYPMRFKLRDPIYSQYPSTLTLLLRDVLNTYSKSRTAYVEFSLSIKDLTNPWIYKYLVDETLWKIPSPEKEKDSNPHIEYRFLVGIQRHLVQLPIDGELRTKPSSSDEALDFLIKFPYLAMAHSLKPEAYSVYDKDLRQLKAILSPLKRVPDKNPRGLLKTFVGLDLVAEELGFPYCPFIQDSWLNLAAKHKLGIRLHCGEGVIREKKGPIHEAMLAHMYIMAMAIRRIRARGLRCRIGHGVAFSDCIVTKVPENKKDQEKLLSSPFYCIPDPTKALTPFLALIYDMLIEVNMTSNSYLVQHANSDSLLKALNNWLLCTDDDGVWAPVPCPHQHKLQAREYCQAISLGYIDEDLLRAKSENWKAFRFQEDGAVNQAIANANNLELKDIWVCKYQQSRAQAIVALALSQAHQLHHDATKPLGLDELIHSFGYYEGFASFAATIQTFIPSLFDPNQAKWKHDDQRIQYFLSLINPADNFYGILRSLFLGYDQCIHIIRFENATITTANKEGILPLPPMIPGNPIKDNKEARVIQAKVTIAAAMEAVKTITKWINEILKQNMADKELLKWVSSRISLLVQRGRSEMEYGLPYPGHSLPFKLDDVHELKDTIADDLIKAPNQPWKAMIDSVETLPDGFLLSKPIFFNEQRPFFHVVWTMDPIRAKSMAYLSHYAEVNPTDKASSHITLSEEDKIPAVWYKAAKAVVKCVLQSKTDIIRIAGVGYSGSAVAVLAGFIIATKLRYHEAYKNQSQSTEVVVWSYGGREFGSKLFHRKVHNLCSFNLEITRWVSLNDYEARNPNVSDSLFAAPHCSQKDIIVYPMGPPTIMAWQLRPSWHYFTLMLHHLPGCVQIRSQADKSNELTIFFANEKTQKFSADADDLESLASTLYFPKYTLVSTPQDTSGTLPSCVWKWNPQQHKTWFDIFNLAPVQTTIRLLGDLLLAILKLDDQLIISPSTKHCDIFNFITMTNSDVLKQLDAEKLPDNVTYDFMKLSIRVESFDEQYCLLLLDLKRTDNRTVHLLMDNIRHKLEKAFSTSIPKFSRPDSYLINNLEILAVILRNNKICNPFMAYILTKLEEKIKTLQNSNKSAEIASVLSNEIIRLLGYGSPNQGSSPFKLTELTNNTDSYEKYKERFANSQSDNLYAPFDYVLSLYFLNPDEEPLLRTVALHRVWHATDWLMRYYNQKEITDEMKQLWKYQVERAQETLKFLGTFKEAPPEQKDACPLVYAIEEKKLDFLTGNAGTRVELWEPLWAKLEEWFILPKAKREPILLGDAYYHYGNNLKEKANPELKSRCEAIIAALELDEGDEMADWVRASLHYLLGKLYSTPNSFDKAAAIYSSLWVNEQYPKEKFVTALNAACCFAKAGGINISKALYWIGNFFDTLDQVDEFERRIGYEWLEEELQEKEDPGDLAEENVRKLIWPWLEERKSSLPK